MSQQRHSQILAQTIRRDCIKELIGKPSSQIISCLASAEILSSLIINEFKHDIKNKENPDNDFLFVSSVYEKALQLLFKRVGVIKEKSPIEEPPFWQKVSNSNIPGMEFAVSVGSAYAQKTKKTNASTFLILSEKESTLPSVYESAQFASLHQLDNLLVIIPSNIQTIREQKKLWDALGWNVQTLDGHNIKQLMNTYASLHKSSKPRIILASVQPARGISFIPQSETLTENEAIHALREIPEQKLPAINIQRPKKINIKESKEYSQFIPKYGLTELISTSQIAEEIKNNMKTSITILEDNLMESLGGIALGISIHHKKVWISLTESQFASSLSQLRVAAKLASSPILITSVLYPENSCDIALARTLPITILSPSDAHSTYLLIKNALSQKGITYIRTNTKPSLILYNQSETFQIGEYKILASSEADKLVILCMSNLIHEALKAHTILKKERIYSSVIDLYSIKPLNSSSLETFVRQHGSNLVIIEDHEEEGGIGEMITHLITNKEIRTVHLSRNIKNIELKRIDAEEIVRASEQLINPHVSKETPVQEHKKATKKREKKSKKKRI